MEVAFLPVMGDLSSEGKCTPTFVSKWFLSRSPPGSLLLSPLLLQTSPRRRVYKNDESHNWTLGRALATEKAPQNLAHSILLLQLPSTFWTSPPQMRPPTHQHGYTFLPAHISPRQFPYHIHLFGRPGKAIIRIDKNVVVVCAAARRQEMCVGGMEMAWKCQGCIAPHSPGRIRPAHMIYALVLIMHHSTKLHPWRRQSACPNLHALSG